MGANIKSFNSCGEILITKTPTDLEVLLSGIAGIPIYANANFYTIIFQSGEANDDAALIYIGDTEMTVVAQAGYVLKGKRDVIKFENQNATNTFTLREFVLMSTADTGITVRVTILRG